MMLLRHPRRLLLALALLWPLAANAASPTVDGTATGAGGANSITATLTTTQTNDIIVVSVFTESTSGTVGAILGVSDVAGLAWHPRATKRATVSQSGGSGSCVGDLEVWWAFSSGILSADVITVLFDTQSTNTGIDRSVVLASGWHGTSATAAGMSPWDPNASLPLVTSDNAGSKAPSATITATTNANDTILGFSGYCNSTLNTAGSGYTQDNSLRSSNQNWIDQGEVSKAVSATQSNLSVAFGTSISTGYLFIADALTADAVAAATSPQIDTVARGEYVGTGSPQNSGTVTLSTSAAGRIILVGAFLEGSQSPASTVSTVSDVAGLTWAKRSGVTGATGSGCSTKDLELWWAYSAGQLSGDVITVTDNTTSGHRIDAATLIALSVSGAASTTAPFDPDASLPVATFTATAGVPTATLTATTKSHDLVIALTGYCQSTVNTVPGSGFVHSNSKQGTIAASNFVMIAEEDQTVSATQSGLSVPFSASSTPAGYSILVDALTADAATSGPIAGSRATLGVGK